MFCEFCESYTVAHGSGLCTTCRARTRNGTKIVGGAAVGGLLGSPVGLIAGGILGGLMGEHHDE